jgi:hypothetical protein
VLVPCGYFGQGDGLSQGHTLGPITQGIAVLGDTDVGDRQMHGLCVSFLKKARSDLGRLLAKMPGSDPAYLSSQFDAIDKLAEVEVLSEEDEGL